MRQGLTDATQSQDTDDSADDTDDGSSTSTVDDATTSSYQNMLPNALAQSVTSAGGTGLAMDLYRSMGGQEQAPKS